MKLIYLLFLVMLIQVNSELSLECIKTLDENYNNLLSQLDFANPILASGTGVYNMGRYDQCVWNSNKFLVLKFVMSINTTISQDFPMMIGLCLPPVCMTDKNIEAIKQYFAYYTKIDIEKISAIDSEQSNSVHSNFSVSLVIIGIILLAYLTLASGMVTYLMRIKTNNVNHYNRLVESPEEVQINSDTIKINPNDDGNNLAGNSDEDKKKEVFTPSSDDIKEKGFLQTCFDINKNYNSLFNPRTKEEEVVKVLDGFKFFGNCNLLLGNLVFSLLADPLRNPETAHKTVSGVLFQVLSNYHFASHLLFSMSGFALSYYALSCLKEIKECSVVQVLYNILYRFLSYWWVYVVFFLLYWKFFIFFLDGPISGALINEELDNCNSQWPFIITFLSDFTYGAYEGPSKTFCFGSNYWYANDFHYFIIGVLFLYVYARNTKLFWVLFAIFNAAMMSIEIFVLIHYDLGVNLEDFVNNGDYYGVYFFVFQTRTSPFFLGFLFGIWYGNSKIEERENKGSTYFITKLADEVKDSTIFSLFLYFTGFIIICFITFSSAWSYDTEWSLGARFAYNFLTNKLYVLGIFLIAFPLLQGRFYYLGGWLGSDMFATLSRLNVSSYLIHGFVFRYFILNARAFIYFNSFYIAVYGMAGVIISYTIAIGAYTLFEAPFMNLKEYFKSEEAKKIF